MSKHARVLQPAHVRRLIDHVAGHRQHERDRVIILLSFTAGLRAAEIAGLNWSMALRPDGRLADHIEVAASIAKKGSGRRLPMNPELARALKALHRLDGCPLDGPIVRSQRGGHMRPQSIVNWFRELYRQPGVRLAGCSSHSGRRTFITRCARLLGKTGGSLRDIQELAGHRAITTTERYIEGDRQVQRKLVRLL